MNLGPQSFAECRTLVDILRWRAIKQPGERAYTFLPDLGENAEAITYLGLDRKARAIGAWLQSTIAPGERVLTLYPPGIDYVAAVFGSIYAGAIAVPAFPPLIESMLPRLQIIASEVGARVALAPESVIDGLHARDDLIPALRNSEWRTISSIEAGTERSWERPDVDADTVAILQYTSGTTGRPKGVILSHDGILDSLSVMCVMAVDIPYRTEPPPFRFDSERFTAGVFWLPPYHDMGLFGGVLLPPYAGYPVTFMSPLAFLQQPFRWLDAISRYRARFSGGPPFAYELCVDRVTPAEKARLDLRHWKVAVCGADTVRPEVIERFAEAFAPCGFQPEAFLPCYGLAEATLGVSSPRLDDGPKRKLKEVDRTTLGRNRVEGAAPGSTTARTVVSLGTPLPGMQVEIVDPETRTKSPPNRVGEIWIRGRSVARGYWLPDPEQEQVFAAYMADTEEGPFLRTGDLGFVSGSDLYFVGRRKDRVTVSSESYYPQDIELTVEKSHPALRQNAGAAFSIRTDGEDRVVIVQEVIPSEDLDTERVVEAIAREVAKEHGLVSLTVVLVRPGSVLKTSSGKIRRGACREALLAGELPIVAARPDLALTNDEEQSVAD